MAERKKSPKRKRAAGDGRRAWPKGLGDLWPLDDIREYENNPRMHPEDQVALLANLMIAFGPDQPIVVDEDGVILKGHGRKLGARKASETDERFLRFPVVQHLGLTEDEKRAIRIADNQVALLSGWDEERLRVEVADLSAAGFDMPLLAFGDVRLEQIMAGGPTAPGQFQEFGENIATEHECPKCHYRWSGHSGMVPAGVKPKKAAAKK